MSNRNNVRSSHQQPSLDKKNATRRRALKALATAGVTGLVAEWAKPVVESSVLPAHAQSSVYSISCVGNPPSGTTVPQNGTVEALVTITPNPGAGQSVTIEGFCNGAGPQFDDSDITDTSGQFLSSGEPSFCSIGETAMVRFSYMGVSAECFWIVDPPV